MLRLFNRFMRAAHLGTASLVLPELVGDQSDEFGLSDEFNGSDESSLDHVALLDAVTRVQLTLAQTAEGIGQALISTHAVADAAQQVTLSAEETAQLVAQLASGVRNLASSANEQAIEVREADAFAAEMAAAIEQAAAAARGVAEGTEQAKRSAERGSEAVAGTVAEMTVIRDMVEAVQAKVRGLGALGDKIGAVVEMIDSIADQTGLLALNAAIEAAHAGEHGRGFAVVAQEVRKLADRSRRETMRIAELIEQVQSETRAAIAATEAGARRVQDGVARADQAGEALRTIMDAVEGTALQVTDIAGATRTVASGAGRMAETMGRISAAVEESAAATTQMATQTEQVASTMQTISVLATEQSSCTEVVTMAVQAAADHINLLAEQTHRLGEVAGVEGNATQGTSARHLGPASFDLAA